jgi:hypothetical protein
LTAERIKAHKQYAASILASSVNVQDVATSLLHGSSEKFDALLMNDLNVGDEFLGQFADGSNRDLNAVLA